MKNLLTKLSNLIKRAVITLTNADDKVISYNQVKYLGKSAIVENVYPYGLSANAPVGGISLLFVVGNNEGNLAAIPYCQSERLKNKNPGEVTVGSPLTGSYIKFLADGDIVIHSVKNVTIECATLNVTGKTNLGSGGAAIARVGDTVDLGSGLILTGSTNNTSN